MSAHDNGNSTVIESLIQQWRQDLPKRQALNWSDIDELERQLREHLATLTDTGLTADEAFLIALKRTGGVDGLSQGLEAHRSHYAASSTESSTTRQHFGLSQRELMGVIVFAFAAAIAVKVPEVFGIRFDNDENFYLRNFSFFGVAPLAAYFVWKRGQINSLTRRGAIGALAPTFFVAFVVINAYPYDHDSDTEVLAAIHLPIALWVLVGIAYVGGDWRSQRKRMDFVRFTGEWIIYLVLISLGGSVLAAVAIGTFEAIGVDVETAVTEWLMPCGAAAATVVAAWLVDSKQGFVENLAPTLTRLFTPFFTPLLVMFLAVYAWTRRGIDFDRDELIIFNVLLAVVLGLLIYAITARNPDAPRGVFDFMHLVLVISALITDLLVLTSILVRISDYGFSPNRITALGENLVLLANLAGAAWLTLGFWRRQKSFGVLERWQTSYLAVYGIWAAVVVVAFPPVFGFA